MILSLLPSVVWRFSVDSHVLSGQLAQCCHQVETHSQSKGESTSDQHLSISSTSVGVVAMVKGIKMYRYGGPEVLRWENIEVGEPREGQIRIRHTAIGLNFVDVNFRTGLYRAPLPLIPGREAVGVVTAVGPGLTGRKVGDRVVYAGVNGAYAEERIIDADKVVQVPSHIDDVTAAASFLKGMTAQFLLRQTFKVEAGHTVLVHAAAGGVGSLLVQWSHALGATVIAAVSSKQKAVQAKEDGADYVIIYSEENLVTRVKEITNGVGVHVVYDSVGKDTIQGSLKALAARGYLVLYGHSSGVPDPIPVSALIPSLYLTRPALLAYTSTRDELLATAGELFAALSRGVLKVRVNQTYPLSEAAKAHADLQARKTTGSTVFLLNS